MRIIAHLLSSIIANSIILYVISTFIPTLWFKVIGDQNIFMTYIILGAIFRFFNAIIKKIVKILTIPLSLITFGLSSIIINILIIYVFGYVVNTSPWLHVSVEIGGIIQTLIISILISLAYFILKKVL